MDNLQLFGEDVLIRQDAAPDRTAKGIFLPEVGREASTRGVVVAVGDGNRKRFNLDWGTHTPYHAPFQVAVGDTVLFERYGGKPVSDGVEDDGTKLLVVAESKILCVVG